jgi:hypothetical protein
MRLACFCGEDGLVFDQSLDPREDIVDVLRSWELDSLSRRVNPGIIHAERPKDASATISESQISQTPTHPGPADIVGLFSTVQNSVTTE